MHLFSEALIRDSRSKPKILLSFVQNMCRQQLYPMHVVLVAPITSSEYDHSRSYQSYMNGNVKCMCAVEFELASFVHCGL